MFLKIDPFFFSCFRYESQSIISAFNPQASANTQDPHLGQTPMMPWLTTPLAGQQGTANQGSPYGSSSNQYMINSNQENYFQALTAGYHQPPGAPGSFPSSYWSALPPAMMFPPPPTTSMLQQQPPLTNDQQSPQSKANNHRSMTPTNAADLLSTSQPNQAQQFINMPRAAATPGL